MLITAKELCIACGLCTLLCPTGAIVQGNIDNTHCILCRECEHNCPEQAIKDK